MKIEELENAPAWLLEAKTEDADVEILPTGGVIWKSGSWRSGVWHDGIWRSGVWHAGTWCGGVWLTGEWRDGEWLTGVWRGGLWRDGEWRGGVWLGGIWHDGTSAPRSKWRITARGNSITIGCKTKTIPEWDTWFAGTEVLSTWRDTPEFDLIRRHYLSVRAFVLG